MKYYKYPECIDYCSSRNCRNGCNAWIKYQEDKEMNKPIFKNEKEASEFLNDVEIIGNYDKYKKIMKEKGYIKKSELEEAKEKYDKFFKNNPNFVNPHEVRNYIKELEKALKEKESK